MDFGIARYCKPSSTAPAFALTTARYQKQLGPLYPELLGVLVFVFLFFGLSKRSLTCIIGKSSPNDSNPVDSVKSASPSKGYKGAMLFGSL